MNILYDHQVFVAQRRGGVSRYFVEMISELQRLPGASPLVFAGLHINEHLASARGLAGAVTGRRAFRSPSRPLSALNRACWPAAASLLPCDVYHPTYYNWYALPRRACRILTVFDLIQERFPELVAPGDPTPERKRHAISRADGLICISEATRRDLIEFHRVPPEKTCVVHLATRMGSIPAAQSTETGPFLLFVGERRGYKNFDMLVRALALLRPRPRLVCVGGGPPSIAEKDLLRLEGIADDVVFRDASDPELAGLYRAARALAYPSSYEGFGLPVLEAMSLGCPVISVRASAIPEVAGDAAAYVEAPDTRALAATISRVLDDDAFRGTLADRGHCRAARFSWMRCAEETFAFYRQRAGA